MARAISPPQTEFALYLFGTFRLTARRGDKARATKLPRRKVEALLAYLALFPDSPGHTRDKLATLFWGDSTDAQARTSLRTALAVLRKTLGDDALVTDRDRIELDPGFPLTLDAREFERECKTAPEHAIELYAGELLPSFYDDWVLPERDRLRALYLATLLRLTQQMRSQSEYERALIYARQVIAADPENETAYQHAMFCEMARGNRAGALEQYDACARALRDELGVQPAPETQGLYHWIKQTAPLSASDAARISNLPIPLTSFVGRKTELAHGKALLLGSRLLTLTGAGGSGKTRLSIQVSLDLMDQFRHGAWWVELAHLSDPGLVAHAVAKALGVSEKPKQSLTETIAQFLREKNILLVMDNCEHLIAACAELANAILRECASVKILATSREPLNVPGESIWHVPTLSVPDEIPSREQMLLTYESVRLFVERARAVDSTFELNEKNMDAVIQICRRLDGIPLALELAAARTALLSPAEIAARIDDRFNLLTQGHRTALPRQQTLRALVDWSYDLLSPDERTLFQRLAVFGGGRALSAIETVCAFGEIQPEQVLDLTTRLVTKSLLIPNLSERDKETRYGFLHTIKQYAREKLEQSGESTPTRDRHLEHFAQLAQSAAPELSGPAQSEWLERIEREHVNFRIALRHALDSKKNLTALQMAIVLADFWDKRGYLTEGREWLSEILQASRAEFERASARESRSSYAWALAQAAQLASRQGDFAAVAPNAQAALEIFRELDEAPGIVEGLITLGSLARMQSEWSLAREQYAEGLTLARAANYRVGIAAAQRNLGMIAEATGDYADARALYTATLSVNHELGDRHAVAVTLSNLANLDQQQGDYAHAREMYDQVLAIHRETGSRWSVAATLTNIGNVAHSQGDYDAARSYHEQSLEIMRTIGDKRGIAIVLMNLGNANLAQKDFATAQKLQIESLRLRRELGDKRGIALTLGNLADIAAGLENFAEAQNYYAESLASLQALGDKRTMANCLIGMAHVAVAQKKFERAAQLVGGIDALLATLDAQIDVREQKILDATLAQARDELGNAFAINTERGKARTLDELAKFAVESL